MFLSVRHKPLQHEAIHHKLIDRDSGIEIPYVIWVNDETGRYRKYLTDEKGNVIREGDYLKTKIFKGNIEIRRIQ